MAEYPTVLGGDVPAKTITTGAVMPTDENGFVTLTTTTYYFAIGGHAATLESIHIMTDASVAGTFTVETCNFPPTLQNNGGAPADVTDYDSTTGNWIKEDPSTAYVASTGTGWTWTNLTGVKTAGAAGAMIHLGNIGSRRTRLKFVCTTGGKVRVSRWAKA